MRRKNNNIKTNGAHNVIKYRMMKKFNEEHFQYDLLNSGLEFLETVINPNQSLELLYSILNNVLHKHAPMRIKRVKREHQPDWFTDEIKKKGLFPEICVMQKETSSSTKYQEIKLIR